MFRSVIVCCLFIFFHTSIFYGASAGLGFDGKIKDKRGAAIAGAHIQLLALSLHTVSDIEGNFSFPTLGEGSYDLEITALGYKKLQKTIAIDSKIITSAEYVLEEDAILLADILIVGRTDRIFSKIPGSVTTINLRDMQLVHAVTANEILRRTPGLHVVDEEGAGLRANIGVRGLDPDRSRGLLVLEDGIPVALAPYGEPEMYYTPAMERMSGVEILKGSGQIQYGPQTVGGVLNYITAQPSGEPSGRIRLQIGGGGLINGLLQYSNTTGNTGYGISLLKKRADKLGYVGFDLTDITGKVAIKLSEHSSLSFKAHIYDETSNATYIGLTQTMYDEGHQDFTLMAPDDRLQVSRHMASLAHDYKISTAWTLRSSAFVNRTSRNWRRQDFSSNFSSNTKPANWTGVSWGDESVKDGAIYMRNSTGNRNRQFQVSGLATHLQGDFSTGPVQHSLKVGIRYLSELAMEQRINGTKYNAESGSLVEDEKRPGEAFSFFIQNQTTLFKNATINYGFRSEYFRYGRDIFRQTFNLKGVSAVRDTSLSSRSSIFTVLPGVGFSCNISPNLTFFGGVHAGFAPPRTKDAISNTGEVYNLDAERSINVEMGMRGTPLHWLKAEVTGFYMDFSNQIIPVSESSGGTGTGLVNGGSTLHKGIESGITATLSDLAGWTKARVELDAGITFTDARFTGDRMIGGNVLRGNRTPYAPQWLINSAFLVQLGPCFGRLGVQYTGNQFSDELNTVAATPNGRTGLVPSYWTMDGNLGWKLKKHNMSFVLGLKNIGNERYIVSRRPQGIRVGLPRYVTFSIDFQF